MKEQDLRDKFKRFVNGYVGSSMLTNTEYPEAIELNANKCVQIAKDYADAQNKELIDALKHLYYSCKPHDVTPNKCENPLYVGSLSFPSEEAIHRTKNILDQLFKTKENEQ